jgi:uncharacterized DUF497 family protein
MFSHIRFFRDPESGQPHIYNHNVSEGEVEEVFRNSPLNESGRPSKSGRPTHMALGTTDAGRKLKVIYALDDDGIGVFVISAYDLRGTQLRAFRRRLRRRGQ